MRHVLIAIVVVLVAAGGFAAEAPLTNADVVKLVKAGISTDVILEKIRSSETTFATDTDSLVALANEKVPEPIIKAMLDRAGAKPGVAPTVKPSPEAGAAAAVGKKVEIQGIYRTKGFCTARGDVALDASGFAYTTTEPSKVCSKETFGDGNVRFAWDDVGHLCFEYAVTGTLTVILKDGHDYSFKESRGVMEEVQKQIKAIRPGVPVFCD